VVGKNILVDCGKPIGRGADDWSLPEVCKNIDILLLTHGHTDHVSAIPDLLDAGFSGPIVGTEATLALTRMNCRDGIRLQGGEQRDILRFCKAFDKLLKRVSLDERIRIDGLEGHVVFREAGHIIGSTSIDILTRDNRVLCSGDLGRPNSPILRDFNLVYPEGERPVDLVVLESTYGNREHKVTAKEVELELEKAIKHALRDGGHILVPAFSIGRTQTLLYHLNSLVESGRIRDLPVAVDSPLGLKVTETYQRSKHLFDKQALALLRQGDDPLEFENLYAVNKSRDSMRLRDVEQSMLIIAGSGMCTGGRIVGHLKELMPHPETCVLFVGYQAQGTPGRRILEAARSGGSVRMGRDEVPVRCEVTTISGLSAHADRIELKRWLDAVPQVKKVALHHGELDTQRAFAEWLSS